MKIKLRMLFVCAAFGLIVSSASVSVAQTDLPIPITGGYGVASISDKDTISTANFAVKRQSKKQKAKIKLSKIIKAERQVVAGLNYRMCLQVVTIEKGRKIPVPQTVEAIVYLDLKQNFSLTSWAIAACTEAPLSLINK